MMDLLPGGNIWLDVGHHIRDLGIAYLLAFPIGWEREHTARSAGVRTFPLVAIATCAFTLIALSVLGNAPDAQSRVFQGLIPGIGFLGAGVIVSGTGAAHGVTTAVSIWVIGAMGMAVGHGLYDIAVVLSLVTFVTLRFLAPLKRQGGKGHGDAEDDGVPNGRA